MHLRPLTDGRGSSAGTRSIVVVLLETTSFVTEVWAVRDICFAARSLDAEGGISAFGGPAGADDDGESFESVGVVLAVGWRDVADVAAARALKTDDAVLACELEESTVPGMSPTGDSFSSTRG